MNATCKIRDVMEKPYNTAMLYGVAALDLLAEEIYLLDAATLSIIHANRAAIEHTGYNAAELLWRNILDLKPDSSVQRLQEELLLLRDRSTSRRDYRLAQLRKDGSVYDTEESLHVFDNSDRAVLMLVVNDVTEHRQADQMMLGEWEHTAAILDAVGDPVIATDTSGIVTRLNRAAANLLGIPVCDAVGASLEKLTCFEYPRSRDRLENVIEMCLKDNKEIRLDLLTFSNHIDSRERMVNLSLAPIFSGEGKTLGCVLTLRNVV